MVVRFLHWTSLDLSTLSQPQSPGQIPSRVWRMHHPL
jgi:hypothetical protein